MVKKTKSAGVHKNALTHGIYAQDIVLPWEIEQDFVDLYEGLRNEFEPDGRPKKRRCSESRDCTGRSGGLRLVRSSPTKLFPMYPRQAKAVGAASGNIFKLHQTEWRS